jgi:hypothetical protein
MSTSITTKKDTHRDEQRRARKIAKEQSISYQAALQAVKALHKNTPCTEAQTQGSGHQVTVKNKLVDSEESYRAALTVLTGQVEAWQVSCAEDEDDGYGDGRLLDKSYTSARQILRELRDNGHRFRVKLDMVEVSHNNLKRFAQAVENHEDLSMAYESSPNHSAYEADEELDRDLRSAKRFLADADKPEYREHYTYEDNPLRQLEATPVPVPDPDGETVDGVRQGTRLRSTHNPDEVRTLLTAPYKDSLGMIVRLSDPRDGEVPEPGNITVWGGYTVLAHQLKMLFEPIQD